MVTASDAVQLEWPVETAKALSGQETRFSAPGSNICLDFHGDPMWSRLVVFSDGNHHMALGESLAAFLRANPDVNDIFYTTTPPGPLVQAMETSSLMMGNLSVFVFPHVFIGPDNILAQLKKSGMVTAHEPFMQSRGQVLLVRKGNPKGIQGTVDLTRDDVRIAISNPKSEKASYQVYRDTLVALAHESGVNGIGLILDGEGGRTQYSQRIHHREVPELLAADQADVAMVYYHLGLRYARIFPDVFELVPLSGTLDNPQPNEAHAITTYHIGVVKDGGDWGRSLVDYMLSDAVADIYANHGLRKPGSNTVPKLSLSANVTAKLH